MRLVDRPIATAKFIGGRLCVDFVNTCSGRDEHGAVIGDRLLEYEDLAAWAVKAGIENGSAILKRAAHDRDEAAGVHRRGVALREACYRMMRGFLRRRAPAAEDMATLSREWRGALAHRSLAIGAPYLKVDWDDGERRLDRVLWAVSESAAEFMTSTAIGRLRECEGVGCGWLFEDVSRNHSRQWCDMQMCGNLAKVRRFRKRRTHDS